MAKLNPRDILRGPGVSGEQFAELLLWMAAYEGSWGFTCHPGNPRDERVTVVAYLPPENGMLPGVATIGKRPALKISGPTLYEVLSRIFDKIEGRNSEFTLPGLEV